MGLKLPLDRLLVDRIRVDLPCFCLGCQCFGCCRYFRPRTIIERDDERQPLVIRGLLDRALEPGDEIGTEGRIIADQPELDAFFLKRGQLAFEVEAHKSGEVGDLFVASPPILRRECIERQHLDSVVDGGLHRAPDSLGARLVTGDARKAAPGCPTPVSVHDDGDVPRDLRAPRQAG